MKEDNDQSVSVVQQSDQRYFDQAGHRLNHDPSVGTISNSTTVKISASP